MATLTLINIACGCEPDQPFCTCPSPASALWDDRYDHTDTSSTDRNSESCFA